MSEINRNRFREFELGVDSSDTTRHGGGAERFDTKVRQGDTETSGSEETYECVGTTLSKLSKEGLTKEQKPRRKAITTHQSKEEFDKIPGDSR